MIKLGQKQITTSEGFTLKLKDTQGAINRLIKTVQLPILYDLAVFNLAERFSEDYKGGAWDIYEVTHPKYPDKKGLLMWPNTEDEFYVEVSTNYFTGTMQAITFGVAVSVMYLNQQVWSKVDDKGVYDERYKALHNAYMISREAAFSLLEQHKQGESAKFAGFID